MTRTAGDPVSTIRDAVVGALSSSGRVVLAVSGGTDSMVMLDAARESSSGLIVATFDHRTGPAAADAVQLVQRRADELGLTCISGRARIKAASEASWREQRWEFLRTVSRANDATIATAHSLDDQVETVFIRILRDSGPRGLAGLYAPTDVVRPLLGTLRREILAYADARGVEHAEDPSNLSRRHLRNRVRLDLLPAVLAVRPSFAEDLLALASRAAEWRERVVQVVDGLHAERHADGSLYVARRDVEGYDGRELAILWPEIAARAGVTMDRRGTHRVAAFTIGGATGGSIQLSGGVEVVRTREHFVLRRFNA